MSIKCFSILLLLLVYSSLSMAQSTDIDIYFETKEELIAQFHSNQVKNVRFEQLAGYSYVGQCYADHYVDKPTVSFLKINFEEKYGSITGIKSFFPLIREFKNSQVEFKDAISSVESGYFPNDRIIKNVFLSDRETLSFFYQHLSIPNPRVISFKFIGKDLIMYSEGQVNNANNIGPAVCIYTYKKSLPPVELKQWY